MKIKQLVKHIYNRLFGKYKQSTICNDYYLVAILFKNGNSNTTRFSNRKDAERFTKSMKTAYNVDVVICEKVNNIYDTTIIDTSK